MNEIRNTFKRGDSGKLEKSSVSAKYRNGRLDRLTLNSPRYSFQMHFGSSKSGTQKPTQRKGSHVKSFSRHIKGRNSEVKSYERRGGSVSGFNKNINYRSNNHIARALNQTKALENLATALGENRIVLIASQIKF
ncbi:MAG: hypothetical protein ABI441_10960 [Flavobacterium sp.]